MTATIDLDAALAALQDEYTYRVNLLLDEGREDLAGAVSERYIADAAALLAGAAAPAAA